MPTPTLVFRPLSPVAQKVTAAWVHLLVCSCSLTDYGYLGMEREGAGNGGVSTPHDTTPVTGASADAGNTASLPVAPDATTGGAVGAAGMGGTTAERPAGAGEDGAGFPTTAGTQGASGGDGSTGDTGTGGLLSAGGTANSGETQGAGGTANLGGQSNAGGMASTVNAGGSLGGRTGDGGGMAGTASTGGSVGTAGMASAGGSADTAGAATTGGSAGTAGATTTGGSAGTAGAATTGGSAGTAGAATTGGSAGTAGATTTGGSAGTAGATTTGGSVNYCSSYTDLGSLPDTVGAIVPLPPAATCYRFSVSRAAAKFRGLQLNGCDSSRTATVNDIAVCTGDCWKQLTVDRAADGYWYLVFGAGTDTGCAVSWWWS